MVLTAETLPIFLSMVAFQIRVFFFDIANIPVLCVFQLIFDLQRLRVFSILLNPSIEARDYVHHTISLNYPEN